MKRVRVRDIKQGRVAYQVYFVNGKAWIEEIFFDSQPFKTRRSMMFVYVKVKSSLKPETWYRSIKSLRDMNIIQNNYNNHKTFWKRKHAEACVARYLSGCLTKKEIEIIEWKKELEETSSFYDPYFMY